MSKKVIPAPVLHRNASGHLLFEVYCDVDVVKPSGASTLVRVGPYYTYAIDGETAAKRVGLMLPAYTMLRRVYACQYNPSPSAVTALNAEERKEIVRMQQRRAAFLEHRFISFA